MNERILELAKKVGLKFPNETALSPAERMFAELIVEECAGIAYNNLDDTDDAVRVSGLILNNFGVR